MSKLKDIPFGSEIPTFDNDGYIALSSGLKGPSGSAIIKTCGGLAFFDGEACYAYSACFAADACHAGNACYADNASAACSACFAADACHAANACYADNAYSANNANYACEALYLNYCDLHLSPSYCNSLSAYLLV